MKKSLVLFTACILVMGLAGCSSSDSSESKETTVVTSAEETIVTEAITEASSEETEESVGMVNPMVEYDSLEEVNETLGGAMCKPAVMGVTDEQFWTIDCGEQGMLGQYCYKVNGVAYTMRFSPNQTGDITGVYTSEGNTVYGEPTDELIAYAQDSGILFARWFTIDGQYVLECESNELTTELFEDVAEEIYLQTRDNAMNQNSDS
ncbi:MAG: hypothetical protein MJ153_09075 [Clostridia bacterium]|nr:hypothetical protein [Clostridia bacterium]